MCLRYLYSKLPTGFSVIRKATKLGVFKKKIVFFLLRITSKVDRNLPNRESLLKQIRWKPKRKIIDGKCHFFVTIILCSVLNFDETTILNLRTYFYAFFFFFFFF